MVRFFIDRPIFASVLSILITVVGSLSAFSLPLSQYPQVTPPTIQIDCNYPGASAKTVSETVAAPIEQQVNGVENMMYMTSQSTSDGSYTLTVTFQIGTNLNLAQILVQNRVNLALPNLPDVVRATGITTRKRSPEILLTVSLNSPDGLYDQLYLSNYAVLQLKDELSRLGGISDVTVFGQRDYSMRIWLDPDRLASRNLSPIDVVNAMREQNLAIAAGQIGQPPDSSKQPIQLTISALGRLETVEQFENVVLKADSSGMAIRVKDIGRVELGSKSHDVSNKFDNKETVGLAIFLLPDANALETSRVIKAKMAELAQDFPDGMVYEIGYDTTPFIEESIGEVLRSLRESIILVGIVVLVFLQSWRAAIIPLAAVPVAIIGTFAAMWLVGFSLNNLTLFGLVLAVGIVVDDAIVVVEAVQHYIELGLTPRDATIRAMSEVTGPVVAVGLVLAAVFVPSAFLSGIVGQFFRQFALTIVISTLISTFNSLTLCPALAALLLRPKGEKKSPFMSWVYSLTVGWFFNFFNYGFGIAGRLYLFVIRQLIRPPLMVTVLLIYLCLLGIGGRLYQILPTGFIPAQDKGYLIASIQLPDASSAARTKAAISKLAHIAMNTKGVGHVNAVAGNSFVLSAYGSNFGSMFIILDPFDKRRGNPDLYSDKILSRLVAQVSKEIPEMQVNIFGAPAVSGLGRAGGFRIMVEDRGDLGPAQLEGQTNNLIEKANQQPQMKGLFSVFKASAPQVFLDVDRTAVQTHGLALHDVFGSLQATMGQRYVNDFNLFGRTWQVNVQAEARFRDQIDDVKKIKIRNKFGEMVPLGAVLRAREVGAPQVITRYNMYPAAAINGNVPQGVSSGDAIAVMEALADKELPREFAHEWTELTFIEKISQGSGGSLLALSVIAVFLVLSALYESYALPLAVIMVVPVCVVASLSGLWITGQNPGDFWTCLQDYWAGKPWKEASAALGTGKDVNIFTQVGFIVLIGLACKNAILIIEFAKERRIHGVDRRTAVLEACKLRFRPIMMTSFAFILGVSPLLASTGAGAEMRQALGLAVFSGMLGVTFFGIFLTPVFFVLIDRLIATHLFSNRWARSLAFCSFVAILFTSFFLTRWWPGATVIGTIMVLGIVYRYGRGMTRLIEFIQEKRRAKQLARKIFETKNKETVSVGD